MNTGMDTDIDNTNDVKKTATTNDELLRLKVDTSSGDTPFWPRLHKRGGL